MNSFINIPSLILVPLMPQFILCRFIKLQMSRQFYTYCVLTKFKVNLKQSYEMSAKRKCLFEA